MSANELFDTIVSEFRRDAVDAEIEGWPCDLQVEYQEAPHQPHALPPSRAAIYVFLLSDRYGRHVPAGQGRVLKVGKAGERSNARFQSQHYGSAAPSTLAKSLATYRTLWPWLGIEEPDLENPRLWMRQHLDRVNIYVPGDRPRVLSELETYIRARVGSVFEGAG